MVYFITALFILGMVLLGCELLVPGFGVAGVIGVISLIICIGLIIICYPVYGIFIALGLIALLIVTIMLIRKLLINKQIFSKVVLEDSVAKEKPEYEDLDYFIGKQGITVTPLKPFGTADFNGVRIDVFSIGPYIQANAKIKVQEVSNNKIIVSELDPRQN